MNALPEPDEAVHKKEQEMFGTERIMDYLNIKNFYIVIELM